MIARYAPAFKDFEYVERFAFYQRAKGAYAIAATGGLARYATMILKKGTVGDRLNRAWRRPYELA